MMKVKSPRHFKEHLKHLTDHTKHNQNNDKTCRCLNIDLKLLVYGKLRILSSHHQILSCQR